MTDEEMAEEFADRTRIVDENTKAGTDCISLVQDYEGNYIDIHERIKQAYLAGLKAGKPEWHKVADGDLPKDTSIKRVFVGNNEYHQLYYSSCGRWVYCDKGGLQFFGDVIAWCEMSTFTDKESE